jgi:hypothetical protein
MIQLGVTTAPRGDHHMQDVDIDRAAEIAALGLTVDSKFVQFSQSRNRGEKSPSLNWSVTVKRNGRDVLTCDYSAGCGHCPSHNVKVSPHWNRPDRMWRDALDSFECESGFKARGFTTWGDFSADKSKPILPDPLNVLYSLNSDADVLNYATFEDWAATFGYDPDSRSAEATYRACLEIGLKLRAALGDDGLAKLNDIFQDF